MARTSTTFRSRSRAPMFREAASGSISTARRAIAGLGDGNGMIVRRGFRRAGNYHEEKLMKAPVGHFFDVITNGFGAMPSYASRIEADDRWRIIAYIRVLQLSENAGRRRCACGSAARARKRAAVKSYQRVSLLVGMAGFGRKRRCVIADRDQFLRSYLFAVSIGWASRSDAWAFCSCITR